MSNIKFTGSNIAAAALVLFYFFPWVSMMTISLSGFSITTNGISPGMLSYFISGFIRIFMILAILVPAGGALILYQNITGNKKFTKYYKPAHLLPAIYLLIGIIGLYFKMKPEVPSGSGNEMFNQMSSQFSNMAPGAFDIMSFGLYACLAAALYLLLVNFGTIKDKEYYKPNTATPAPENKSVPPAQEEAK